jgi:hypothetical protein
MKTSDKTLSQEIVLIQTYLLTLLWHCLPTSNVSKIHIFTWEGLRNLSTNFIGIIEFQYSIWLWVKCHRCNTVEGTRWFSRGLQQTVSLLESVRNNIPHGLKNVGQDRSRGFYQSIKHFIMEHVIKIYAVVFHITVAFSPQCVSVFMPPIIKCRGHYVMAYASVASVPVSIWFPSFIEQTPWSTDPIFLWLIAVGVIRGRFLSMINSAAHPRWPLRPPSWISFPFIFSSTPGSTGPVFWWLIGDDWRKVPFDDQLCHSSKMATTAAILDFVSVD